MCDRVGPGHGAYLLKMSPPPLPGPPYPQETYVNQSLFCNEQLLPIDNIQIYVLVEREREAAG